MSAADKSPRLKAALQCVASCMLARDGRLTDHNRYVLLRELFQVDPIQVDLIDWAIKMCDAHDARSVAGDFRDYLARNDVSRGVETYEGLAALSDSYGVEFHWQTRRDING